MAINANISITPYKSMATITHHSNQTVGAIYMKIIF